MKTKENQKKADGKWDISFAPITRYSILFCGLVMLVVAGRRGPLREPDAGQRRGVPGGKPAQVTQRVEGTVSLLEPLASLPSSTIRGFLPSTR